VDKREDLKMAENVQEFSGKERMLIDWMSVRNSILRSSSGEMNVVYKRSPMDESAIIGVVVNLDLQFANAVGREFTEDEKGAIDKAKELKDRNPEQL
jgi:hypothetical protein